MAIEQFIEPNFRVLIGYFLLMRWGCWIYFRRDERNPLMDASRDKPAVAPNITTRSPNLGSGLVWLLFLVPILLYAILPTATVKVIGLPDVVRWIFVAFAVVAILLFLWSKHVDTGFDAPLSNEEQLKERSKVQPFRIVRHPAELSDVFLFITLAAISDRALVVIFAAAAVVVQVVVVVANKDGRLRQVMGAEFIGYAKSTGRLLPKLPVLKKAQYQVPRRFGLAAIIGLMTGLSVIFGLLNALAKEVPIAQGVYLFIALQVVGVCVAQLIFGSTPRLISAVVGALLLPAFVALQMYLDGDIPSGSFFPILLTVGAVFGALLGYCIGTVAAGFFLVMDWFEQWFTRKKSP